GGAAGAATSVPRQFLVAAASTAALVVAVLVGLASGGEQEVPAARSVPVTTTQPAQPTRTQAPAQPTPTQPTSTQEPTTTTPTQEPTTAPATTTQAPTTQPTTQPAPTTTTPEPEPEPGPDPEPEPTPPNLVPLVPSGFALTPGEDPVDLPITVRNTGGTASEPASAVLDLPPGVRSVGPAASFAGERLARLDGAAEQSVACPAGTGTVTCATTQGIAPGGTATFLFRVQADAEAATGRITGTVRAGTASSVPIEVPVEVRPAPDGLELLVRKWHHGFWQPRLDIKATNTGGRAGDLRLVVEADRHVVLVALRPDCERTWQRVVCEVPLGRGESFRLGVWAFGEPHHDGVVRVTATLGTAARSVEVPISANPGHGEPDQPGQPGGTPTPPTTSPEPTTTGPTTPPTGPTTTTTGPTPPRTTDPAAPPTTRSTPPPGSTSPPDTTAPTTTTPTTTPRTTQPPHGKPCRPAPPWLPPLLGDLLPDRCDPPS
ncbi:MAG: hypothetical protein HOV94_15405, partial [Saccharothrix sp.]|nr:hypothetical protein [Saccharothrix sp.]